MTWLSRFSRGAAIAVVVVHTGCTDRETTSLEGAITCGSLTCGDGQLCKTFEPHPGEALQYSCVTVSAGCEVFDCVSDDRGCGADCDACPACITAQCGYLTRLDDRDLICLGF